MAHTSNPSYLGGKDQEDCSSRPTRANSCPDPISKILNTKRVGGVAQVVECLLSKHEIVSSNPSTTKNKQTKINREKEADPETIWVNKLTDKYITTAVINVFPVLKKIKERVSILKEDMTLILKNSSATSKSVKYMISDEKYRG
jgi:hypothetical protein